MDHTYRTELRELNELNFSRFDDKLERRLGEFRADLERPLADIDRRLSNLERRFAELDPAWDRRLTESEARWRTWQAESEAKWRASLADLRAELIKWMFLFWLGTVASVLGIGRALLP